MEREVARPITPTQAEMEKESAEHIHVEGKPTDMPSSHDNALDIFDGRPEEFVYTSKEATRVRWKIDLIMLPMMIGTYILNYMDKVAFSEASVFGIREDLKLVRQQYSWASSIFYLGYLVWQYPSAVLMQKLPIGRYFGVMILLWGLTTTTTVAVSNFATLSVNRVFLGVFETCSSPILTILVSSYWSRDEQPLRASIWWYGSAVGGFVADSITYGVSSKKLSGSRYATWQIIYLVFGPLTLFWGLLIMFLLPTSPMTAWFLTKRERKVAVARIMENNTSIENRQYKWNQVRECLIDPQTWMLAINAFLQCLQGGGLTSFSKIVLTGMGYSSRESTLMAMPSNAIHLVSVIFAGWFCSRVKNTRCMMMIATNILVLIGAVMIDTLPSSHAKARLAGFYIIYVNTVSFGLGMSMVSSNIAGFTKKATASAMMFLGYCFGQFTGPQFFISTQAPRYTTAFRAFYASVCLMIFIEGSLMCYLIAQNRKRDRESSENDENALNEARLTDLTDWEQRSFRYIY